MNLYKIVFSTGNVERSRRITAPHIEAAIRLAKLDEEYKAATSARILSAEEL